MEVIPVLLMITLIVIVITQNSKFSTQLEKLQEELKSLRQQLIQLANEKHQANARPPETPTPKPEVKPYKSLFTHADDVPVKTPEHAARAEEPVEKVTPQAQPVITRVEIKETVEVHNGSRPSNPAPGFFERNPDMEKFIGENLVSKIGIAVLVLAIGFFVKYSIDQNWMGPVARVANGIVGGAILITLAHRFRNKYRGFSSVLAGGGIAVFYFTITLAFQQFQLFSQTTAFIIMIVITIFAVLLALLYGKQELAIIALIGGFLAPYLVSTGNNNYQVLFSYLIILNSGLLVIAYNKSWRLLNLLSFIFTTLLFTSWLFFLDSNDPAITYRNGFLYATVFYLLFFVINIAHNTREQKKFIGSDFGILLANTSLYFAAGIYCLNNMEAKEFRGLFSAAMGVFNLCVSYFLFRRRKVDTNILYLLIGITLTFISLTAPIQLSGNYITLFWASESVLLYWLFTKSRIPVVRYASVLVWGLMLTSLLMDWKILYGSYAGLRLPVIVNQGFITSLFAAVATYLLFLIRAREDRTSRVFPPGAMPGKRTFRFIAIGILFAAGALEIEKQFTTYYPYTNLNMMYLLLYTLVFTSIMTAITERIESLKLPWHLHATFYAVCIFLYLIFEPGAFNIQAGMLEYGHHRTHFIAHWASAILIATMLYRLVKLLVLHKKSDAGSLNFFSWVLCIIAVIFLSVEVHLLTNQVFYAANNSLEDIRRIYIKTGLPILWGLCSFGFMWAGMHFKYRTWRIISLSLFTLTLLKLFIFDIRNIPAGGKIAAFFCLGVLLLVVSFMYQRLKKIIIDEENLA